MWGKSYQNLVYSQAWDHWITWLLKVWAMLSFDPFWPLGSYMRPLILPITSSKAHFIHQFFHEVFLDTPDRSISHYLYVFSCAHHHILIHLQLFKKISIRNLEYLRFLQQNFHCIRIFGFSGKLDNLTPQWASIPTLQQLVSIGKQLSMLWGHTLFCLHGPYHFLLPPSLWGWMLSVDYNILFLMFFL